MKDEKLSISQPITKSNTYLPIIDSHVHIYNEKNGITTLLAIMEKCNFDSMNILSLSGAVEEESTRVMDPLTQNIICALSKALYPERIFIFGGLHHPVLDLNKQTDYAKQAKRLIKLGFDGMKMIEGKTPVRKSLGKPLDSSDYDEYYAYMESEEIPILFHVADPETFWDREKVPGWALERNWFYGDGTYPEKETLYKELNGILKKFPKLSIIFAHFYFMSADIERASAFLDKWENISFDLTPGAEMYENFSKRPDQWHDFFVKHQNQIIFGTDIFGSDNYDEDISHASEIVNSIRSFLETNEEFQVWGMTLKGICLEKEVLGKIYFQNFQRYVEGTPKKLNIRLAIDECERVLEVASKIQKDNLLPKIRSVLEKMEGIFHK